MNPLRIIILGLLFYFLFRLLSGSRRRRQNVGGPHGREGVNNKEPIQDVLVEDPVCHKFIPKAQAVQAQHDKKIHYFCSQECCEKFLTEKGV